MDEIKSKVLNFVKKQGTPGSKDSTSQKPQDDIDLETNLVTCRRRDSLMLKKNDDNQLVEDDKVLEDMDEVYYSENEVDVILFQLNRIPSVLSNKDLLARQLTVVSKKVLQLILEHENKLKNEFSNIQNIRNEVGVALDTCRDGRKYLKLASQQFTVSSLSILANYKRKQCVMELLSNLRTIETLQQTDHKLQQLILEQDFPGAINLLQECQLVTSNFNHFKCVSQLSSKLNDTLYLTKQQLDMALSKICQKFDVDVYSKLQEAYNLLDDSETSMDQLLMHFTSEIHNVVFNIVHKFANTDPNVKLQFKPLCQNISVSCFITCLKTLCQNIWCILNSYHNVVNWHENYNKQTSKTGIPSIDVKQSLTKQHVKQKLENGLLRLWNDVQSRICIYLSSHNLADYKFEELLQILSLVHRLIEIGEEFCGSKSEELQNSIRQQSINYFKNYHHLRLDELKIFLENESWTLCPVKKKFTLLHLQEFKCLRKQIETFRKHNTSKVKENLTDGSIGGSSTANNSYFNKYQDHNETPFDIILDETVEEDIHGDVTDDISGYFTDTSDDSENEELKKDYVEETPCSTVKKKQEQKQKDITPILANTTLTVLRHCGKYLQMSRLLKPIAFDVIICLCQLFEYYLYNIYILFTKDLTLQSNAMFSFKLQTTIKKINENLILADNVKDDNKIAPLDLNSLCNFSLGHLNGLSERVVGVESLIFLGSQFEYIQNYVLHLIPEQKKHFLQQFYLQTVGCIHDLRRPAYMCVSANVVDMKCIIKEMSKVDFEVRDVMSQHSSYVDQILRELQIFSMKLDEVEIHIPNEVYDVLWENIICVVNSIFVEGFSNAKKCSNGGRALMQLDYTQFLSKLAKITKLTPIPNREFVDLYVKAYYLQEPQLEEFVLEHREYSVKQLEALVTCACQNNKRRRLNILSILEGSNK